MFPNKFRMQLLYATNPFISMTIWAIISKQYNTLTILLQFLKLSISLPHLMGSLVPSMGAKRCNRTLLWRAPFIMAGLSEDEGDHLHHWRKQSLASSTFWWGRSITKSRPSSLTRTTRRVLKASFLRSLLWRMSLPFPTISLFAHSILAT